MVRVVFEWWRQRMGSARFLAVRIIASGPQSPREVGRMNGQASPPSLRNRLSAVLKLFLVFGIAMALGEGRALAFGDETRVQLVPVQIGDRAPITPEAGRRLSWEVRQRTSIDTALPAGALRLDDSQIFRSPLLYWRGDRSFAPLGEQEIIGLRRFVEFGGFLLVDDAGRGAFTESVRRALGRALPRRPIAPIAADHVIYRSFYLVNRPVGRVRGPGQMDGVEVAGRMAVVLSRHDLGGAWARDNLGNWLYSVDGGGRQREMAIRLGVNLVMYALCLDYKDDQVHAPYIMRRRGGTP